MLVLPQKVAEKNGWITVDIISEYISGTVRNEKRPAVQQILARAKAKEFDIVLISELSRISRTPYEAQKVIECLTEYKIPIFIQSLNLFTLTDGVRNPLVDLIVVVSNQWSALELSNLKFRIASGIKRAQSMNIHCGRPKGSCLSTQDFLKKHIKAVKDLKDGISLRRTAKLHTLALATVIKIKNVLKSQAQSVCG